MAELIAVRRLFRVHERTRQLADTIPKWSVGSFNKHVTYRLARKAALCRGTAGNDLAVTAVLHEQCGDRLAVVAGKLKSIGTPASIRLVHLAGYESSTEEP